MVNFVAGFALQFMTSYLLGRSALFLKRLRRRELQNSLDSWHRTPQPLLTGVCAQPRKGHCWCGEEDETAEEPLPDDPDDMDSEEG
jgi:hypothetical protein